MIVVIEEKVIDVRRERRRRASTYTITSHTNQKTLVL
jgi:hypothetical protein